MQVNSMRSSDAIQPKGSAFTRMAIASALTKSAEQAIMLAEMRWGENSQAAAVTRAAVGAGTTGGLGPLTAAATDFMSAVHEHTILGALTRILHRIPPNTRVLTHTAATASWVKPGNSVPLSGVTFADEVLRPLMVAAMSVHTDELLRSTTGVSEDAVRRELVRAVAEAIDIAFIDPANAGVSDEAPAAVTNGVTAVPYATSFKASLEALIAAFDGDLTQAFLVGKPELFVSISGGDFPNVGARGGEVAGIPAIASRSVPDDAGGDHQLVLVDPAGILYAGDDGAAQVRASRQASIQMADNPTNSSTVPTAANVVSLWQSNSVALLATAWGNWKRVRVGSVALLDGIPAGV